MMGFAREANNKAHRFRPGDAKCMETRKATEGTESSKTTPGYLECEELTRPPGPPEAGNRSPGHWAEARML